MSKEMNKLLQHAIKYDLGSGLLISLLIVLFSSFLNAMIYFIGLLLGLMNFVCSVYVMEKLFLKDTFKGLIGMMITILRIMIIVMAAIPFVKNTKFIALYIAGFISHLIVSSISFIKNK
ncbi:hypothetical protein [uncultured Clostridium sp.]|uniref:hypothetical protein n=1 Tax=uncultured Clostridium sp. TaxID=59620 RepID=UPI0025EC5069|nr:hypothetical protein [uncultured Clostridium sp.]